MIPTTETLNQWYILRGENKYGPFQYAAMINMLQKNELYDYNYVWAPHMDSWTLLGELEEFSKDRLARLIENNTELRRNAFVTRGAPRAAVRIPVYGHNGQLFFDGTALSLSANGALLLLNSPLLLPEQRLLIHFRPGGENPEPFNACAVIVRKNFTRTRINVKSGLHYAVRFTEVSRAGKEILKRLCQKQAKEA